MVGSWRFVAAGGWRLVAVGKGWRLMGVGGPSERSLTAVVGKNKIIHPSILKSLNTALAYLHSSIPQPCNQTKQPNTTFTESETQFVSCVRRRARSVTLGSS